MSRMPKPAVPALEQWLLNNPGWHDVAAISAATGYAYSTTKNGCEYLVIQRKAVRDGVRFQRTKLIQYRAIVDYYGGFRVA